MSSGNQNTSGELNVAIGPYSLESNTTANYNVGLGYGVLKTNTTGAQNTVGAQALSATIQEQIMLLLEKMLCISTNLH